VSNKQQTVLIVEDDTDLNGAYSMILDNAGYNVRAVEDGQKALSLLESGECKPALILLDLRMPVLDGIGFLRKYKGDAKVVVFSNYDAQQEVDEAFSLGAERYILKARSTPKELVKLVGAILN